MPTLRERACLALSLSPKASEGEICRRVIALGQYNTVYYWVGGSQSGQWRATNISPGEIESTIERLERMGYYAVPGNTNIGPPEGPPRS